MQKNKIREELKIRRQMISDKEFRMLNNKIFAKCMDAIGWNKTRTIHVYRAIKNNNEVDTSHLIDFIKQEHPSIKIYSPEASLKSTKISENNSFDVIIVPTLGFDRAGNRLGYGGGYYDKFLARNNSKQIIGLAYNFCEIAKLPIESHDQKLHKIITDLEIINP